MSDKSRPFTAGFNSRVFAPPRCDDIIDPGEPFEHWCDFPRGHTGDHRCGDCGDIWNPAPPGEEPEPHRQWDGTCAECREMQAALSGD